VNKTEVFWNVTLCRVIHIIGGWEGLSCHHV